MRLYLLPISTRRTLLYCEPLSHAAPVEKQSYIDRGVAKANTYWADWEKDTKSPLDWKKRVTTYGNMMFRRIPFEEWGLKSVPPLKKRDKDPASSGVPTAGGVVTTGDKGPEGRLGKRVEVHYPGVYQALCHDSVLATIKRAANERRGLHRKRMWWSAVGMPITLPIGLLPVIPNIPFFYLMFRAWSHWRALAGSSHLIHLVQNHNLHPMSSPTLDSLYTTGLLHPSRSASRTGPPSSGKESQRVADRLRLQTRNGKEEVMLLAGWNGKVIAEKLGLPGLEVEIERAVEQVRTKLDKEKEVGEVSGQKREVEELSRRKAGGKEDEDERNGERNGESNGDEEVDGRVKVHAKGK